MRILIKAFRFWRNNYYSYSSMQHTGPDLNISTSAWYRNSSASYHVQLWPVGCSGSRSAVQPLETTAQSWCQAIQWLLRWLTLDQSVGSLWRQWKVPFPLFQKWLHSAFQAKHSSSGQSDVSTLCFPSTLLCKWTEREIRFEGKGSLAGSGSAVVSVQKLDQDAEELRSDWRSRPVVTNCLTHPWAWP